jgi:hypothetical protein
MKRNQGTEDGLSRRNFLRTTAAAAGATALTGLSAKQASAAASARSWDKEADIVVVGYGGAGAVAAITAHDAGSKVIVIEKAPEGGGNTKVGGAQFCYSTTEKKNDAALYLNAVTQGTTPMDVCQAWADEIVNNRTFLDRMGVKYLAGDRLGGGDFRGLPGADGVGTGSIPGYGIVLFDAFDKQMKARNIEILYESPATELIEDPVKKEVLGVKVKREGKEQSIKARKAVILCTGGFEFNDDMKKNYLRPSTIKFVGWKYNTGDGIKMAQALGADLWHMSMIASALYTVVTPESEMGWMYPEPKGSNFILVTRFGERFMKEGAWFPHRSIMGYSAWDWKDNRKSTEYPCCPHYMIFDETTRLAGAVGINEQSIFTGMGNTVTPKSLGGTAPGWGKPGGGWSKDNSVEIEKGWIKKADSIAALAKLIGGEMSEETLTATVKKWNGNCEAGVDSDFGRGGSAGGGAMAMSGPPEAGGAPGGMPGGGAQSAGSGPGAGAPGASVGLAAGGGSVAGARSTRGASGGGGMFPRNLEKIETPPFYAIELWPGGFNTLGGPKKNAKGQVLHVNGEPIKRLYEAGSLGHTMGQVYSTSGANYGELLAWGRISGKNAAAEPPWA